MLNMYDVEKNKQILWVHSYFFCSLCNNLSSFSYLDVKRMELNKIRPILFIIIVMVDSLICQAKLLLFMFGWSLLK